MVFDCSILFPRPQNNNAVFKLRKSWIVLIFLISLENLYILMYISILYNFYTLVTKCYERIDYKLNAKRQSACLVINSITLNSFDGFSNCGRAVRA